MNIEDLRTYCLGLKHTTEDMPFGDGILVFKVCNKMFCLVSLEEPLVVLFKCDPEEALEMREAFAAVEPGFHMNKKYWNMVTLDGSISTSLIEKWIYNSYKLVIAKLPKKTRNEYGL